MNRGSAMWGALRVSTQGGGLRGTGLERKAYTDSEEGEHKAKSNSVGRKRSDNCFPFTAGMKPWLRRVEGKVFCFSASHSSPSIQVSPMNLPSLPQAGNLATETVVRGEGRCSCMPSGKYSSLLHPRENRWHKEIHPKGPTHLPGVPGF